MKTSTLWLFLILVVAFALRAWSLSAQCLDIDEFAESQVGEMSIAETAWRPDSMPPLFPLLLKACLAVWPHDMTGRWLSLAIGVATVGIVGVYWRHWLGQPLALATAALLAVSPLHIYYSQYVRSYGLMMFWTALATGALARAVDTNRRRDWMLFAASALGGLYTHYYFALFLAVLSLAFAFSAYGWRWGRSWWVANLCALVLALPLVGFVKNDLSYQKSLRDSRPLDVSALGYTYVSMLTGYTVGPSKRELQVLDRSESLRRALPVAAAAGMVFACLGLSGVGFLRKRKLLLLLLTFSIAPVLLVGLLGVVANVTYNPRFVVWSLLPLLAILAAGAVSGYRTWSVRLGITLLVGLSATAVYNRQFVPAHKNEDMRAVGEFLASGANEKLPVFVLANYMMPGVQHYLPDEWLALELPRVDDVQQDSSDSLATLAVAVLGDEMPEGGNYWLVYTREFHGDPDGEILNRLGESDALDLIESFDGIKLYRGSYSRTR